MRSSSRSRSSGRSTSSVSQPVTPSDRKLIPSIESRSRHPPIQLSWQLEVFQLRGPTFPSVEGRAGPASHWPALSLPCYFFHRLDDISIKCTLTDWIDSVLSKVTFIWVRQFRFFPPFDPPDPHLSSFVWLPWRPPPLFGIL